MTNFGVEPSVLDEVASRIASLLQAGLEGAGSQWSAELAEPDLGDADALAALRAALAATQANWERISHQLSQVNDLLRQTAHGYATTDERVGNQAQALARDAGLSPR